MGSSKKHKDKDRSREHKKKKKHRSRSRSRDRDRHHKKDESRDSRKRKHLEDGEIEEEAANISEVKQELNEENYKTSPDQPVSSSGEISLSIEETNKMRAKLGLKPLEVKSSTTPDGTSSKKDDIHTPAVNLADIKRTEELREKMAAIKEKRKINQALGKVKTLGDSDDEDLSAMAWITKSRKIQKEQEMAAKRAQMLEEMDAEFGIGDLVEEEFGTKKKDYSSKDLKGLKVQHDQARFKEGQTVILTLEDRGILEEGEDTLVNVNLVDSERTDKNLENKRKRPEYKGWDEPQYDEFGMHKAKEILDKYDEEIHGEKKQSFQLDAGGKYDAAYEKQMAEMRQAYKEQGQSLQLPAPATTSEYYTQNEMEAQFKKVKKKVRKIRKKPKVKADDLAGLESSIGSGDHGSRIRHRVEMDEDIMALVKSEPEPVIPGLGFDEAPQIKSEPASDIPGLDFVQQDMETSDVEDTEILGPDEDLTGVMVEPDEAGQALEVALHKARKVKQMSAVSAEEKVAHRVAELQSQGQEDYEEEGSTLQNLPSKGGVNIVLNSTSEFCRALGDIPTYGMSGNRVEDQDELMDFEQELVEERKKQQEEEDRAGWTQVEIDTAPVDIKEDEVNALDDEPVVNEGIGAALHLAMKKGYIQHEDAKRSSNPRNKHLLAQSYTIEDKRYDDLDEKYSRKRDRYSSGITMEFKELDNYKPDVKLEYVDDSGRMLNEKEAFRQLSHRFHGKGSGKRKTEKRQKKLEEEQLMKQMSSTDTPLGTVNMLQEKQRAEKSPYIVLSGSRSLTANSLTKH